MFEHTTESKTFLEDPITGSVFDGPAILAHFRFSHGGWLEQDESHGKLRHLVGPHYL